MIATENDIRMVLWHFGLTGGWKPGGFAESLLVAWDKADVMNDLRLQNGFPELAEAITLVNRFGTAALTQTR